MLRPKPALSAVTIVVCVCVILVFGGMHGAPFLELISSIFAEAIAADRRAGGTGWAPAQRKVRARETIAAVLARGSSQMASLLPLGVEKEPAAPAAAAQRRRPPPGGARVLLKRQARAPPVSIPGTRIDGRRPGSCALHSRGPSRSCAQEALNRVDPPHRSDGSESTAAPSLPLCWCGSTTHSPVLIRLGNKLDKKHV